MGKIAKIRASKRAYRGVSALPRPQGEGKPDERGLFDLRPMRFAALDGASAEDMLIELVNLPEDPDSDEVSRFMRFHNLELGATSSGGHKAKRMSREEVNRYRGLYRIFWQPRLEDLKARTFLGLIGPSPKAWISEFAGTVDPKDLRGRDIFPMRDYAESGLRMNWKTGRFSIAARGPIDFMTHAVFRNRNRLRACSRCKKLFVAFGPKELLCSTSCKLESGRDRKKKWWRKNRGVAKQTH